MLVGAPLILFISSIAKSFMVSNKILVMGPSWVGDMVLAHSLFQILKQQDPDVQIDVAAPAWTLPLLDRMPEVTGKIALPFKHGQLSLTE
ncbi:hypothetical protein BD31_I2072, partial [Candidatus Nitrosopumilus salaria BD31]